MSRGQKNEIIPSNLEIQKKNNRARDQLPSQSRIVVLDYLKGLAACWFTLGHMMMYYQDGSWASIVGISTLLLDWLTICLFVSCTVIGTMLSIRQKEAEGNTQGMFKNALKKSVYFFIIGEIINLVIEATNTYKIGIWHIFGANMITVVALVQLFTYGFIKIGQRLRLFLAIALIVFYPILLSWCLTGITLTPDRMIIVSTDTLASASYVVYYLLLDMDAMMPTLSWLITSILTSIIFEEFVNAHVLASLKKRTGNARIDYSKQVQKNALQNLACFGLITISFSVMIGGLILTPGISTSAIQYGWLTNNDPYRFYYLGGIPLFIVRHTPLYLVFNLGVLATVFSILHYRTTIFGKKLFMQNSMAVFGKYSFSVFVYEEALHFIGLKLSFPAYLAICVPIFVTLFFAVNLWASKGKGIGSLEWGLNLYSRAIDNLSKKHGTAFKKK